MLERIDLPLRDDAALQTSLNDTLARCPYDLSNGVWLFVYGLLAYDPPFGEVPTQVVTLEGFRRRFCLADTVNRGTPEAPGLTIGLMAADETCTGLAYHLAGDLHAVLTPVWQQEMLPPFYVPVWMEHHGQPLLGLVTDADSPALRLLAEDAEAAIIRTSAGKAGLNTAYLDNVRTAFADHGVADAYLDRLDGLVGQAVHARQHAGETVAAIGG